MKLASETTAGLWVPLVPPLDTLIARSAGAFIALGALFYTVTMTTRNEVAVPFGLLRLAGGVTFSLGLCWWWVERNSLPAIT